MGAKAITTKAVSYSELFKELGVQEGDGFWQGRLEAIDGLNVDDKSRLQSVGEKNGMLTLAEVQRSNKESYHPDWLTTAWKPLTTEEKDQLLGAWNRAVADGNWRYDAPGSDDK